MSSWAINTLRRVAGDLRSFEDGRLPHDAADAFVLNLELVYREIIAQEQLDGRPLSGGVGTIVARALDYLKTMQDEHVEVEETRTPPMAYSDSVGRPRFDIPQQQLRFLVESGFTGPKIATIIGVSLSTVRRRMSEYGLYVSSEYASLSDNVLDQAN